MSNKNLHKAKEAKNDEFYTQLYDIENEILRYVTPGNNPFEGKTVLCPCDDPLESNFTRFFAINFSRLGLKKFISTGYKKDGKGKKYVLEGDTDGNGVIDIDDIVAEDLEGDGDFRSDEVTMLRDEADIICTNPPFSLFREFIDWIMTGNKQFIILGNINAITYKEVFPFIRANRIWLGIDNGKKTYVRPDGSTTSMGNTCWFTNIQHSKRVGTLILVTKSDNENNGTVYTRYANHDVLEVPAVRHIPSDYDAVMGVPVSFLDNYNPVQFALVAERIDPSNGTISFWPRERELAFNDSVFKSEDDRINSGWAAYLLLHPTAEPVDFFYPSRTSIAGVLNTPDELLINGTHTYKRLLIKRIVNN